MKNKLKKLGNLEYETGCMPKFCYLERNDFLSFLHRIKCNPGIKPFV